MIQKYSFVEGGGIEFEDTRSVRELIQFAFDKFGYYEPAGMELVTLYQAHHPDTYTGWFTTDIDRSCKDEILDRDWLCFAYHMKNVFYFAEGGWGHHMKDLGNHPIIPNPVSIVIRFEDFNNTVVINGKYCFTDIIHYLLKTQYVKACRKVLVHPIGISNSIYPILLNDNILKLNLADFVESIKILYDQHFPNHGYIYHEEFEIC